MLYELSLPPDRNFDYVGLLIGTEINDLTDLEVPIDSIIEGITGLRNIGMDSLRQGHAFDAALILIEASSSVQFCASNAACFFLNGHGKCEPRFNLNRGNSACPM